MSKFLDYAGLQYFNTKLNTKFAGKQNTLTAGEGITINGDTISVNASAPVELVTYTKGNEGITACDHTFEQIKQAYESGKVIIARTSDQEDRLFQLGNFNPGEEGADGFISYYFASDNGYLYTLNHQQSEHDLYSLISTSYLINLDISGTSPIQVDSNQGYYEISFDNTTTNFQNATQVQEAISAAISGAGSEIITFTFQSRPSEGQTVSDGTCDHTLAQIKEAYDAGKILIAKIATGTTNEFFSLCEYEYTKPDDVEFLTIKFINKIGAIDFRTSSPQQGDNCQFTIFKYVSAYDINSAINTKLANYTTTADLNTMLASYTTDAELATALEDYTTDAELTTALADYTTTDGMNTAISSAISTAISSVYRYKGSVATVEDLPTLDNVVGDVYDVQADGMNYAWNGTTWDALGGVVDPEAITNAEIDAMMA